MTHQKLDDDDDDHAHVFSNGDQVDALIDGKWEVCTVLNTTEPDRLKVREFHMTNGIGTWVPKDHVAQIWTHADPAKAHIKPGMKVFTISHGGPYDVVARHKSQVAILVDDWIRVILRTDLCKNQNDEDI